MRRLAKIVIRTSGAELILSPNALRLQDDGDEIELETGVFGTIPDADEAALAKIIYADESDTSREVLHSVQLVENTDYDFSLVLRKTLSEFKRELKQYQGAYPFRNNRLADYVSVNAPSAWSPLSDSTIRITGRINFKNYAGSADFSLHDEAGDFKLYASVLTEKLTDDANLFGILSELSALCSTVIFQLDAPTEIGLSADGGSDDVAIMFVFHLRRLLRDGRFSYAVDQIIKRPAYRNRQSKRVENIAFANQVDLVELASNPLSLEWVRGGALANRFLGYTPIRVPIIEPKINYDIPENQYVKSFLVGLASRIDEIASKLGGGTGALRKDLAQARDYIFSALSVSLWRNVSNSKVIPYSMIMQQRAGYRDFSEATSKFGLEATLARTLMTSEDLGGELKPVWYLYQIWCCIQLIRSINAACGKPEDECIERVFFVGDWNSGIRTGKKPIVSWSVAADYGPIEVELFYNKEFNGSAAGSGAWDGSYSLSYYPDISVAITSEHGKSWLHFDAKYRVDRKAFAASGRTDRVKSDDIEKMHTYRDALLGTRGSYVLYPSIDAEVKIFVRHADKKYWESNSLPSIGAFPLHPGDGEWRVEQQSNLSGFISEAIKVLSGLDYQEETGFRSRGNPI
ncbi:hypothetical protein BI347_17955 [Chromobacterium sphagni]|uniref:DUF2357 domain-containing protein n=1 Tax=Chromobacterium sphagni TaxID=1903179 RepID=A0A1S1WWX1_9NEIS|nr:DUF2357 domain-containing protein [Chromobacterium sphagni]OHX11545.1 hypothetical protein BI347_17955 [Chromobacterium sphagni]